MSAMATLKVLIVGDEADAQNHARAAGMQIVEAANGGEAVATAEIEQPDVILLDEAMNAPATLAALQSNPVTAHIPVVVLVSKADTFLVERLQQLGSAGVINKPVDPLTLTTQIRAVVGLDQAVDARFLELRERFLSNSLERLDELSRDLDRLTLRGDDQAVLEKINRTLHGLAGVGGTMCFSAVSRLARTAELECRKALERGRASENDIARWRMKTEELRFALTSS